MFGRDPEIAGQFYVYSYEHLDDLSFLRDPAEVFHQFDAADRLDAWLNAIKARLRGAGWEGDGDIRIMWLPPFVDVGREDTYGTYAWVVKQNNNGTSWIASPTELAFTRLNAQNGDARVFHGLVARPMLHGETARFVQRVRRERETLCRSLDHLDRLDSSATDISTQIVENVHNKLVQLVGYHFDDCYLNVLDEAINNGNRPGLKLRKSQVRLALSDYLPTDSSEETASWFTLHGVVSDLWQAYKFEPFDQKAEMLFKAVDFVPDRLTWEEIRKHVCVRNCHQHHDGQLVPDLLTRLGRQKVTMRTAGGDVVSHAVPRPASQRPS